jgi:simple sugar transport system permease protein
MKRLRAALGFASRIEAFPTIFVFVALYALFIIAAPEVFTKPGIYMSFLETIPPVLIVGLGLTLVITAGEIDLSFPAVIAFSGLVFSWAYRNLDPGWGPWVGLLLALAAGAFVGYINGLMVARIGVPSIMATLAAQFFWYGVTILLAGGLSVALKEVRGTPIHEIFVGQLFKGAMIGDQTFGGLPVQSLWALALAVFLWFLLNRHKFGEAVSFIGDNANVARVMGINVEGTKIRLFMLQGAIAAFAGIILTLDINVFYPNQGNFLLPVMAGVFVGGTSIAGGNGLIVGTFFGAYVIGSLEAGIVASRLSGYWVQVAEGVVMTAIMVLNAIVGDGRIAAFGEAMRRWTTPSRLEPTVQPNKQDSAATD